MQNKPKKCKGIGKAISASGCGKETMFRQYGLCRDCYVEFMTETDAGKLIIEKARLKASGIILKKQKQQDNEQRDKLKTLSQFEAEAKRVFQKWIRKRDEGKPCISCGNYNPKQFDAGHFKKAEIYSGVIFDERNVHSQCSKCNRFLGGNELEYRAGLVNRFGEVFVLQLEADAIKLRNYKYTKEELKEIKETYLKKLKL